MKQTKQLVLAALFLALGVTLPQAFHAVPNAGSVFLPMHIPVLLGGMVLSPLYALAVGILTPILSSLIFHMPPVAYLPSMVCELAVYGLTASLIYHHIKTKNNLLNIYIGLIGAMLCGRITYGILNALIFRAGAYSLQTWLTAAFVTGLPGIIIQLIVIPILILALQKAKLIEQWSS